MSGETETRLVNKAFRFRIYPTPEQARAMSGTMASCRFVYNHFLRERIDAYERTRETVRRPRVVSGELDPSGREVWARDDDGKVIYDEVPNESYDPDARPLSYFDTSKALTQLKRTLVGEDGRRWLYEADSVALVYSLRHLDNAYKMFFKRVKKGGAGGFPRFKPRGSVRSYTTKAKPSCLVHDADGAVTHIQVPKVGDVRVVAHRDPEGTPYAMTVSSRSDGRWFVSIACKDVPTEPLEPRDDMVGLTLGISPWVVTSDGEVFESNKRLRKMLKRLAREQRRLSRKVGARKGEEKSANFLKQRQRVARIQSRIADQRRDDTHKLTRALVDEHGVIVTRETGLADMMATDGGARGDIPNVARRNINRALSDSNLAEVNRQLAYKSEWAGRGFVCVPGDFPTAQTCTACGYKNVVVATDIRSTWTCPNCGTVHNRRYNGSVNVLQAGMDYLEGTSHNVTANRGHGRGVQDESS